jgi:phosphoribosylanthranilate isomerase
MSKIKICGLSRPEDIGYANACMPDYAGFVFAPSRRRVSAEAALNLKTRLDPRILAVGVFVNDTPENIHDIVTRGIINLVQLHGDEDDEYVRAVKWMTGVPVIKAIRIGAGADIIPEDSSADYLLFDAESDKARGGTGKSFDWRLVAHVKRPFFLAGGLNPANIKDALRVVRPYCFDVSSGAETDGRKDYSKMLTICDAVRE